MRTFDYKKLENKTWDNEITRLLSFIHEERGKQELYLKQKPLELEKLVEIAKVQSTEASNAIEGIRTTNTRLRQLMNDKTKPRNRDEKEIAGYRDALNVVHESFDYIPLKVNYILQLHEIMLSHTDSMFAGQFKNVQNYISATDGNGRSYTLFTPLDPFETPIAMESLCEEYNRIIGEGKVDPLLVIPIFIHDFLCIHPFMDGNGRMSRLLTTLLLYHNGYYVGRYISLEAKISNNKDLYYDSLYASQQNWYEENDDPIPFIKYILGTIASAYKDFETRVSLVSNVENTEDMVRRAVVSKIGKFTKADIHELIPSVKEKSLERYIKILCDAKEIEKHGQGKSTYYIRIK